MPRGLDCGTFNLVSAKRGDDKNEVKYRKEVNAFLEISLDSRHTFNMLKAANVPLIEREKVAYVVGDAAVQFAYAMPQLTLRRPMKDGCLNPQEKDAYRILSIMMHSIIGEVEKDGELVYFSVPANAVNEKTDADYHEKVLEDILKKYKVNGKTIKPCALNEALAIIYAELAHKAFTGVAVSWGSGMVNVCYSVFSHPVFKFSITNSGDWIDEQAAKACGESTTTVNKIKHGIDLTKIPTNIIERAIHGQYRILIEKTMSSIKKAVADAGNQVRIDQPVDFIMAGGCSSCPGFTEIVKETLEKMEIGIPIGEVRRSEDPLYSVARGLLIAAEHAN